MQWEYKIVRLDSGSYFRDAESPSEAELNELGADGWELAAAIDSSEVKLGGRGGSTTGLVFKRPVEDGGSDGADGSSTTGQ
ncbi:hypothetical protein MBEHAL_1051 [Halarchaeum acidiphilum MH1-52-1]|uniref:DUF4177 domain-containing protein n=1 Tax=Halarchaeum acidiphilum MH1-52-1 TaxID=1261545 RepID=U2YEN7_9EURY|nr:DUF4177 domain-containing protein [Halarchaeum acidiphilum]GAD52291.1 hypothetical protein MBEHAL_1051 [Halarchaeum acidiphilum MH1-52-1]